MFGAPSTGGSGASSGGFSFGGNTGAASGGSIFGAPAASSGGSIFGASAGSTSGSIFGAPSAASSGGGLFSTPAASSGGGGSIFSAPAASSGGGGGLFSASAGSSGGNSSLFGQPNASSGGGGIFGASSASAAPTSGGATSSGASLFGASGSSSGAATGWAFGASTGGTTGSSLFGASSSGTTTNSLFAASSTGGASSGSGVFGATGGGATALENTQIQQAKLQVLENRKVDDLLRNIEDRIAKQTSYFDSFASQIVQVDAEILGSVTKIKELENEYRQLNDKRQVVDNTINEISNQQSSLMQLLVGIQQSLNTKSSQVTDAPKSHEKTLRLMQYMEDLDSMVDNLTSEIQKVHVNSYSSTVAQVAQILNSQTTCLDTMQQETEQVAERIKQVEKMF